MSEEVLEPSRPNESFEAIEAFQAKFPRKMRDVASALLVGQAQLAQAFDAYKRAGHQESLEEAQHPGSASSSSSSQWGHESFNVGQSLAGLTLSLRVPTIRDNENNLTLKARAYIALVGLKHIKNIIHAVSSGNELVNYICDYHKNEGKGFNKENTILIDYLKSQKGLYEEIQQCEKEGYAKYKDIGLSFGDMTAEEKFKFALAAEIAFRDKQAIEKEADGKTGVVPIVQDSVNGIQYTLDKKNNFIAIPAFDSIPDEPKPTPLFLKRKAWVASENKAASQTFLQQFAGDEPSDEKNAEEHENMSAIGYSLMVGATKFKKTWQEWKQQNSAVVEFLSYLCTDSRTLARLTVGPSILKMRRMVRIPGPAMADKNGDIAGYDARMFIALEKERLYRESQAVMTSDFSETTKDEDSKATFVHGHHSNCGAEDAIYALLAKGAVLPQAFIDMANHERDVYECVMGRGANDAERIAFYKGTTGVNAGNDVSNCQGLQQLYWDREGALKQLPKGTEVVSVFQHTQERRMYVYSPKTKKLEPVPTINGLVPDNSVKLAPTLTC